MRTTLIITIYSNMVSELLVVQKNTATLPMINDDVQMSFLERWNRMHSDCGEVVIGYDSTNKNCHAGDIEIVEFGHEKLIEAHLSST